MLLVVGWLFLRFWFWLQRKRDKLSLEDFCFLSKSCSNSSFILCELWNNREFWWLASFFFSLSGNLPILLGLCYVLELCSESFSFCILDQRLLFFYHLFKFLHRLLVLENFSS